MTPVAPGAVPADGTVGQRARPTRSPGACAHPRPQAPGLAEDPAQLLRQGRPIAGGVREQACTGVVRRPRAQRRCQDTTHSCPATSFTLRPDVDVCQSRVSPRPQWGPRRAPYLGEVADLRTCTRCEVRCRVPARAGTPSSRFCLRVPAVASDPAPTRAFSRCRASARCGAARSPTTALSPASGGRDGRVHGLGGPTAEEVTKGWAQAHRHRSARRPDRSPAPPPRVRSTAGRRPVMAIVRCWRGELRTSGLLSPDLLRHGQDWLCRAATDPVRSRVPLPRVTHRAGAPSLF